jgi:hypothetical protein
LDRSVHGVKGALGDQSPLLRHVSDQESLGLIAMPAIDDRSDIDIDDIAILEDVIARDPMADHIVDACATAFAVAQVPQGRRGMLVGNRVFVDELIDPFGRDARLDEIPKVVHQLGVESAGRTHLLSLNFRELEFSKILKHVRST